MSEITVDQLIKELIIHGYSDAANIYNLVRYEDEEYASNLDEIGIKIAQVNDYDEHVREAIADSYSSVPVSVIIEYRGSFFKSQAEMGSYIDSWEQWKEVKPKQVTTIIFE